MFCSHVKDMFSNPTQESNVFFLIQFSDNTCRDVARYSDFLKKIQSQYHVKY